MLFFIGIILIDLSMIVINIIIRLFLSENRAKNRVFKQNLYFSISYHNFKHFEYFKKICRMRNRKKLSQMLLLCLFLFFIRLLILYPYHYQDLLHLVLCLALEACHLRQAIALFLLDFLDPLFQ